MLAACAASRTKPVASAPSAEPTTSAPSSCASCHATIAEEWRSSFHRAAFTDETFQASLALEEPREHAFCIDCHAPAKARADGVDCAACHGSEPHEKRGRAGSATCARCHEFAFDPVDRQRPELVQKTLSEHAASDFASVG